MKKTLLTLCSLGAAALTSQAAVIANWQFDSVNDSISTTAGTLAGGATLSNSNLNLTGTGGFDSNTSGGLGGTGSFTVISDFSTTANTNQTIFDYTPTGGTGGGQDLRLFAQANGNLRVEMSIGAGFEAQLVGVTLNDGETHRIAVIFDSANDSFLDLDLYIDGTLYDVTSGTDHTVNLATTASSGGIAEVSVGYRVSNTGNRTFTGAIDFVQIHDTALSAAQIASIPEPSSAALLGLGGITLILRRRR